MFPAITTVQYSYSFNMDKMILIIFKKNSNMISLVDKFFKQKLSTYSTRFFTVCFFQRPSNLIFVPAKKCSDSPFESDLSPTSMKRNRADIRHRRLQSSTLFFASGQKILPNWRQHSLRSTQKSRSNVLKRVQTKFSSSQTPILKAIL